MGNLGTHNHVVLAQHGHLPQGLVGESVEVVGTVLPPAPALLPARMHQLLCKQARHQGCSGAPSCPATPPPPIPSTWEILHQAGGLWRTGLALMGGAWGMTQQGRLLPGAAVILIGHLSSHTGPATQRTKGYQRLKVTALCANTNPHPPNTISFAPTDPCKVTQELGESKLQFPQLPEGCALVAAFPFSLPGLPRLRPSRKPRRGHAVKQQGCFSIILLEVPELRNGFENPNWSSVHSQVFTKP